MKYIFQNKVFEWLIRLTIGITFIYASFHKIADPAQFAKIIYGYGLFPHMSINLITITIPYIELVMGMALVLGVFPRSATMIIALLLAFFIVAISINLIRGHEFDCGCFTFGRGPLAHGSKWLLARNIFLLLLCIHLVTFGNKRSGCLYNPNRKSEYFISHPMEPLTPEKKP
ncbi:MAG: DoxX family membrane protein [Deltaproteobacteria bacterium]|nr:DoxX family membrane protein [Deltaproteobacteria bacterium]